VTQPKYPKWSFFSEHPDTPFHAYLDRSARTACGQIREPMGFMWSEETVRAKRKPLCEHCLAVLNDTGKLPV